MIICDKKIPKELFPNDTNTLLFFCLMFFSFKNINNIGITYKIVESRTGVTENEVIPVVENNQQASTDSRK
jgi:hypothetical protein